MKIFTKLRERVKQILQTRINPRIFFAIILDKFYSRNIDRIPFPFLGIVIEHLGGWAGVSIYISIRQIEYDLKIKKIKDVLLNFVLPIVVVAIIIIGGIQDSNNFFFGFVQNLLAEIILVILIIYILPKLLSPKKKYNVSIMQTAPFEELYDENYQTIVLYIKNIGQEVYKKEEVSWELFVGLEDLEEMNVLEFNDHFEKSDEVIPMWKFSGLNKSPLFLDQELNILKVKFKRTTLAGQMNSPFKVYYRLRTINGNIPTREKMTKDFMGYGFSIEKYPQLGELVFYDWYHPEITPQG